MDWIEPEFPSYFPRNIHLCKANILGQESKEKTHSIAAKYMGRCVLGTLNMTKIAPVAITEAARPSNGSPMTVNSNEIHLVGAGPIQFPTASNWFRHFIKNNEYQRPRNRTWHNRNYSFLSSQSRWRCMRMRAFAFAKVKRSEQLREEMVCPVCLACHNI